MFQTTCLLHRLDQTFIGNCQINKDVNLLFIDGSLGNILDPGEQVFLYNQNTNKALRVRVLGLNGESLNIFKIEDISELAEKPKKKGLFG